MKTMKMIDLLVKITNREEVPRTILYRGETYTKYQNFNGTYYYKSISRKSILLLEQIRNSSDLLYEVGIIEEDKKLNGELREENKKYKEIIDKAIEYINDNLIISSILDGKKYYTINNYSFDYRELLDILKEVK